MPGFLMHVGAVVMCPHGAPAQIIPAQPRVLVTGQPVATMTGQMLVTGCPFTVPPGKPQPCFRVQWLMPSVRVLVSGQPAMLAPGPSLCQSPDQIPNGPALVATVQPRVIAT